MTYDNRKMPWGLKGTASSGQKFIWNMVGSMSNALSSFLLLAIVTRINGSADGGIFSLAFSTAQFLTTIGCFETRAIQATDVKDRVAFKDYFSFRVMTCVLMMAGAFVYGMDGTERDESSGYSSDLFLQSAGLPVRLLSGSVSA